MTGFTLAYAGFLLTHFVPTRPRVREQLIWVMGRRAWFSIYGLISLAVTVWVIWAAGRATYIDLWPQLPWTRWVPNLVLPVAIALTACGLPAKSVTLGGPRVSKLDPKRPGFAALTRHPLLWALVLWSGAHLFPNGDLAHVILFGGFALMGLAAMPAFDARARQALDPLEARDYFAVTSILSVRPLLDPAWRHQEGKPLVPRLVLAAALWLALLLLHPLLIGVTPLPL
ncbi:NnrU family protein [Rubellimicrobium rubrum]|uniref:NnrU family protein n=1 Tax=Rubellimicrobium rubrum TaxID=2585369 RepID=A0A5C4N618_9RHOB|nr:NnrU family protein [Rubellimicrobium rubrum]TNC51821.1 NnrU family protein [Rubellimicrobium rubrum]